jgi:hypothetical protein
MSVTIDISDQDVFTALVSLFGTFLPTNTPVVQGLDNQVSMPATGFVLMTSSGMERMGTNVNVFSSTAQTNAILAPIKYAINIDFVGPLAQAWAMEFQALFRDEYATDLMPANIQPLFADDLMHIPLVDAESQFEQRWRVSAAMHYAPTITTTQQSATVIGIGIEPIDQTFHP